MGCRKPTLREGEAGPADPSRGRREGREDPSNRLPTVPSTPDGGPHGRVERDRGRVPLAHALRVPAGEIGGGDLPRGRNRRASAGNEDPRFRPGDGAPGGPPGGQVMA